MSRSLRRSWGPWLWVAGVLVVFAIATALATPSARGTSYDPQSAAPEGTRAIAELLRNEGIDVERTTDVDRAMSAGDAETLIVAHPQLLPPTAVRQLESLSADVVLLGPTVTSKGFQGVEVKEPVAREDRAPACQLPAATSSGSARTGGVSFAASGSSPMVSCYPAAGGPTLVQLTTSSGSRHTVLGSAEFMTNEWLDDSGNAALAMNLLGANSGVVWWLPSPVFTGTQPLTSLLPSGVWPVLGTLIALVLVNAAWRGRRLGPVVVEPLPVAVRASETTEGRGRIYQRHRTRAQAAHHLRALTSNELARRLGLPPGSEEAAVVSAVAASTGRASESVAGVLYGPPPERDEDLVTLGRQLADLDLEVRRS